jgi:hypothetical protein
MTESVTRRRSLSEPLITAFAIASVFIILGFVIAFTPDISQKTNAFVNDLTTVNYNLGSSGTINLLAPAHPSQHITFFRAVMEFLLAVGVLQIIFLALRLGIRSPIRRISETIGNLVFWLGGAVVANVYLLAGTRNGWFEFWTGLILVLGISLIARFTVYLVARSARK